MAEDIKVIVFKLGVEEYGIEVEKVQTIERMMPITRVPKTYSFIKGVINLRGVVIPVIDLRTVSASKRLNTPIRQESSSYLLMKWK